MVIFSDFYPDIIVTCVILKVFFFCVLFCVVSVSFSFFFFLKKKKDFCFSLYLAKIFDYFFPCIFSSGFLC
jgi:hypothetical protein